MSQVHPRDERNLDSHDQSNAQDQPQIGDQPQALVQPNRQGSSQSQLNVDAGNFTCFPKLPLELQRNIWEVAAVPQPRVIQIETICERDAEGKIHPNDDDDDDADDEIEHWSPTQCSPTPLLGICRESRSIAMKYYKYSSFLNRPLFYNTDLDTLWVRGNPLFQSITNDPPSETTLEVLFWQRRYTELGPYLFRSVALDFAGIKAHHEIVPWGGNIPQDPNLCTLYAVSKAEVEKVYIVYSSGDCRDEVDQEVKYLVKRIKFSARHSNTWTQRMLREKNERDGTNLTKWKMPTVEAILDTRLINPVETFHNFPDLPLKVRRAIWKLAAIPHHRAIQIEPEYEGIKVESDGGRMAVWRNQMTSPCYPNALFETCRESRHIAITKYDHSKAHTISTQVTEACNIPRRFYYNMDKDIMWMRGDPLCKTTSAGVIGGILHNACYEQFANIAIDVETFVSKNFPQGQENVFPVDLFRPTDLSRTLPFLESFALKKLYLVYSRADQKDLATEVLDQSLDHMKRNEKTRRERFNSIMNSKGIEGRPWSWPVVEAILESDLFEDTKGWRNNRILR